MAPIHKTVGENLLVSPTCLMFFVMKPVTSYLLILSFLFLDSAVSLSWLAQSRT